MQLLQAKTTRSPPRGTNTSTALAVGQHKRLAAAAYTLCYGRAPLGAATAPVPALCRGAGEPAGPGCAHRGRPERRGCVPGGDGRGAGHGRGVPEPGGAGGPGCCRRRRAGRGARGRPRRAEPPPPPPRPRPPSAARSGAGGAPRQRSGMKEPSLPGTSLQRACRLLVAFCALHLSATLLYYLAGSALGPPGSPEPPPRRPPPANLSLPLSRPSPPAARARSPPAEPPPPPGPCPEPSPLLGECRPGRVWGLGQGPGAAAAAQPAGRRRGRRRRCRCARGASAGDSRARAPRVPPADGHCGRIPAEPVRGAVRMLPQARRSRTGGAPPLSGSAPTPPGWVSLWLSSGLGNFLWELYPKCCSCAMPRDGSGGLFALCGIFAALLCPRTC